MAVRSRKMTDKIPEPTLRRLPWYLSNAKLMKEKGGEVCIFYTDFPDSKILSFADSQRLVVCGYFRTYKGGL